MASLDISQLRNVTSDVIRHAEKTNSRVYNVLGDSQVGNDESFKSIFSAAVDNISTTNAYLSDAERFLFFIFRLNGGYFRHLSPCLRQG